MFLEQQMRTCKKLQPPSKAAKIHDFCFGIPFGEHLWHRASFYIIYLISILILFGGAILALNTFSSKVWRQGKSSLSFVLGEAFDEFSYYFFPQNSIIWFPLWVPKFFLIWLSIQWISKFKKRHTVIIHCKMCLYNSMGWSLQWIIIFFLFRTVCVGLYASCTCC